jgi:predicted house-cleaning noncanonical NTP pyrophosphatase (MazG superfamily)
MSKTLVRNNTQENTETVASNEFIEIAYNQISDISLSLNKDSETDDVLEGMSDMLELMKAVLKSLNIKPEHLFNTAHKLSTEEGTFSDMKAVPKEQ